MVKGRHRGNNPGSKGGRKRKSQAFAGRLNADERRLVWRIRAFLRIQALLTRPDRLAALVVQAFRTEFSQARLGNAYARGIPAYRRLLRLEGGSLAAAEAASRLGISVRALQARYHAGTIVGFRDGPRLLRFPVWQFAGSGLLPGLEEVLGVLNEADWVDDTGNMMFFLQRSGALGGLRPLDCLRSGDLQSVLRVARGYIE